MKKKLKYRLVILGILVFLFQFIVAILSLFEIEISNDVFVLLKNFTFFSYMYTLIFVAFDTESIDKK